MYWSWATGQGTSLNHWACAGFVAQLQGLHWRGEPQRGAKLLKTCERVAKLLKTCKQGSLTLRLQGLSFPVSVFHGSSAGLFSCTHHRCLLSWLVNKPCHEHNSRRTGVVQPVEKENWGNLMGYLKHCHVSVSYNPKGPSWDLRVAIMEIQIATPYQEIIAV